MGITQDLDAVLGSNDQVKIPDLDWVSLDVGDKANIPTANNVEIIPQLQEAWSHTEPQGTKLVPNSAALPPKMASEDIGLVEDVVDTAKKEMMIGTVGTELAEKLASLYHPALIRKAKDALVKVAEEQGLLGNVYIDLSPFESCSAAMAYLGHNRIRTARFVVGEPKHKPCRTHKSGHCQEFKKKVVAEVLYDDDLLDKFTTHLKIAGRISAEETIGTKDALREAFLKVRTRKEAASFFS